MGFINGNKNKTTFEKLIQANLFYFYYKKFNKIINTSFSMEDINISNLLYIIIYITILDYRVIYSKQ